MDHKIGPIYGINSVNPAIRASAHIFGKNIPNNHNTSNATYTTIAIVTQSHNCAFNHNHILR